MYNRDTSDGQKQLILGSISLAVRELAGWSTATAADPIVATADPAIANRTNVRSGLFSVLGWEIKLYSIDTDIQATWNTHLCIQENDIAGTQAIQESIVRISRFSFLFPIVSWLVGRHTRPHKVRKTVIRAMFVPYINM